MAHLKRIHCQRQESKQMNEMEKMKKKNETICFFGIVHFADLDYFAQPSISKNEFQTDFVEKWNIVRSVQTMKMLFQLRSVSMKRILNKNGPSAILVMICARNKCINSWFCRKMRATDAYCHKSYFFRLHIIFFSFINISLSGPRVWKMMITCKWPAAQWIT